MNVLVVGNGGREHALAWKLSQSPNVAKVYVAPGNAGTALDAENVDIAQDDFAALIQFAKDRKIGLTVVGPEAPLVAGLVDAFTAEGLRAFGPSKKAAQMEGSKIFCKEVLNRALVPTARSQTFDNSADAYDYIRASYQNGYVVKAEGLAAEVDGIRAIKHGHPEFFERPRRREEFGFLHCYFTFCILFAPAEENNVLVVLPCKGLPPPLRGPPPSEREADSRRVSARPSPRGKISVV